MEKLFKCSRCEDTGYYWIGGEIGTEEDLIKCNC